MRCFKSWRKPNRANEAEEADNRRVCVMLARVFETQVQVQSPRAAGAVGEQVTSLGKFVAARGHNAARACPSAKCLGTALRGMLEMRKKVRKPRARYAVGYGRPPTSSQFQPGPARQPERAVPRARATLRRWREMSSSARSTSR